MRFLKIQLVKTIAKAKLIFISFVSFINLIPIPSFIYYDLISQSPVLISSHSHTKQEQALFIFFPQKHVVTLTAK